MQIGMHFLARFSRFLFLLGFFLAQPGFLLADPEIVPDSTPEKQAERYGLSNAPRQQPIEPARPVVPSGNPPLVRQGNRTVLVLPDGRRLNPWQVVPEGWVVSDDGSLLTEEGVIIKQDGTVEYPFGSVPEGYVRQEDGTLVTPEGFVIGKEERVVQNEKPQEKQEEPKKEVVAPEGSVLLPDGAIETPTGILKPDGTLVKKEDYEPKKAEEKPDERILAAQRPEEKPVVLPQKPPVVAVPGHDVPVQQRTEPQLWSMLPLSEVPGKEKPKVKEANAAAEKPKTPKKEEKPLPAKPKEKPTPPEKPKEKPQPKPKAKPKIGDELTIPPDAAKTGKLDFLEGCWQGTRPEYYSKRIIKECFCFGANGKNGKRRVIDPKGGRRCVGATSARLSSGGVLHVSSQGAVCSDGERWGQAEMTCRGKGQHTPCSWVFRDANGGQQSYEIPFVRVESCGRKR
ncbi:MAG: hypothetical protein J5803_03515 [Desulfovibrio sp.]|nr:hypothetical protein [Desulfovibrio sp.]